MLFAGTLSVHSQSFELHKSTLTGVAITNGGGYNTTTKADNLTEEKIVIKNISSSTQTYSVKRSIVYQNPTLILDGSEATPQSYFCFGFNCFASDINEPTSTDYTVLQAAGVTYTALVDNLVVTYSDNSKDNETPFSVYLKEGSVEGEYVVRYKVYNIANANDTIAFTVNYNKTVGIRKNEKSDFAFEIYPNPSNGTSKFFINLNKDEELNFKVYNTLGSLVYTGNKQKYSAGKNQLNIGEELNSGVYFITLSNGTSTATRRLVVTK